MPSARTLAAAAATLSRADARTKRFTGGGGGGGLTTADGRVAANAPATATTSAQATAAAMRPGWRRDVVDASSSSDTSSSSLLESSKTQLSLGVAMTIPSSSCSVLMVAETPSLAAAGLATSSKPSPMAPLSIILRESLHLDLVNCVSRRRLRSRSCSDSQRSRRRIVRPCKRLLRPCLARLRTMNKRESLLVCYRPLAENYNRKTCASCRYQLATAHKRRSRGR